MDVDEALVTVTMFNVKKTDSKVPKPGQVVKVFKFSYGQMFLGRACQLTTNLSYIRVE